MQHSQFFSSKCQITFRLWWNIVKRGEVKEESLKSSVYRIQNDHNIKWHKIKFGRRRTQIKIRTSIYVNLYRKYGKSITYLIR
jgi:hypothetical protein